MQIIKAPILFCVVSRHLGGSRGCRMDEAGDAHYLSFLQLSLGLLVCIGVSALKTPKPCFVPMTLAGLLGFAVGIRGHTWRTRCQGSSSFRSSKTNV